MRLAKSFKLCLDLQKIEPKTYVVGGAVRDMLLGKSNFDVDIATAMLPAQTKAALKKLGLKPFEVGEKFGTIGTVSQGRLVEITTFRKESDYKDFRHPEKIKFIDDPKMDASRRDFTINALFYNPANAEVLDFFGGAKDLKERRLRFVGSPEKRIKEDPLRLLRAIRFAAGLNFAIAPKDFAAIKKCASLINKISGQRIKGELDKIFTGDNAFRGVELMDSTKLLAQIFPEIENLKKVKQSKNYHAEGSAFVHTMNALANAMPYNRTLRYAAFLHDIGKFGTGKQIMRDGRKHMSFHGHSAKGSDLFLPLAKRLAFSQAERAEIEYLITHHMDYRDIAGIPEEKLIRASQEKWFENLVRLRIIDSMSGIQTDARGRIVKKDFSAHEKLLKKIILWKKLYSQNFLDGDEVMHRLNLKPGQRIGEIIRKIKLGQAQGKIKNKKQALNFLKTLDNRSDQH